MSNPNAGMDEWMGTFTCANCEETFLNGGSAEYESIEDKVIGATFCSEECHPRSETPCTVDDCWCWNHPAYVKANAYCEDCIDFGAPTRVAA